MTNYPVKGIANQSSLCNDHQGSMCIDNGYYKKDYRLIIFGKIALTQFLMNTKSNGRVNSCAQVVQKDFPLLSHPSPLPQVSQRNKHHKEPFFTFITFYSLFFTIHYFFTHTLFQKFMISICPCLFYMGDSLISPIYRNISCYTKIG